LRLEHGTDIDWTVSGRKIELQKIVLCEKGCHGRKIVDKTEQHQQSRWNKTFI
jgi:hypothetical protein